VKLLFYVTFLDGSTDIGLLASVTALKPRISEIIEPDFGLLNRLLGLKMLTRRQLAQVRSKETVYDRNDALLDLLESADQCDKFIKALQLTDQQHVVNLIAQKGG